MARRLRFHTVSPNVSIAVFNTLDEYSGSPLSQAQPGIKCCSSYRKVEYMEMGAFLFVCVVDYGLTVYELCRTNLTRELKRANTMTTIPGDRTPHFKANNKW